MRVLEVEPRDVLAIRACDSAHLRHELLLAVARGGGDVRFGWYQVDGQGYVCAFRVGVRPGQGVVEEWLGQMISLGSHRCANLYGLAERTRHRVARDAWLSGELRRLGLDLPVGEG